MRKHDLMRAGLLGAGLLCASAALAVDFRWKNAAAGNWNVLGNWQWIDWSVGVWTDTSYLPRATNGVYLGNSTPGARCVVPAGVTALCDFLYMNVTDADGFDIYGTLDMTQPGGTWDSFNWGGWSSTVGGSVASLHAGGTLKTPYMTGVYDTNPTHESYFNQEGGTANIGGLRIRPSSADVGKLVYNLNGGTANINRITGLSGTSGAVSPYLTLNINGGGLVVNTTDFNNCVTGGAIRAGGVLVNAANIGDLLLVDSVSSPGNSVVMLKPPPRVTGSLVTNQVLVITFEGGELQSAPAITGPWTGTGNSSGVHVEQVAGEGKKFYRVSAQLSPGVASNPNPANGATGVPTAASLSWTAGSGATSHDVYFGTSNPPGLVGNQAGTTYNPGTLSASTTYYWRIDEKNVAGTTTGTVWSFTTGTTVTGRQTLYEPTTGRRYILYVPTDYNPGRPYPLIISSHGTSQNGDTEMDSTGPNSGWDNGTPTWPTLAEANDVIVACPDMTGAYGEAGCAISSTHASQLASDEIAVLAIITRIESLYNVNASCILLTGFSGGGNPTHYVGLRHPDIFCAISARHGNFHTALVPNPLPIGITNLPAYIFTGSSDAVCGTSEAISWYTAQGFNSLKTDVFTTSPSDVHTTDRHHALNWFLGLITRIMPLGDSITYDNFGGDTRPSSMRTGYRSHLWYALQGARYPVDFVGSVVAGEAVVPAFDPENEGHGGWTDSQIAGNIYGWLQNTPADIILLHIGTNALDTNPADVQSILAEIDRYEANYNRHVKVLLARIINRNPYSSTTTTFNNNVAAMAQTRINNGDDIIIVDMENGAGINYSTDMRDTLHPNDAGYQKMANLWFTTLQTVLP